MATVRSPNYPNIPLSTALEAMRPAFKSDGRNKMSRLVLAKHLGYTSINGRSLGKIGAVRAYGLIEGSGEELKVTEDTVTALMAPEGSADRKAALNRLATRPSLFQELRKDFPETLPSLENLKYSLIKKNFTPDGAEKAARVYLATMNLVAGVSNSYNPPDEEEETDPEPADQTALRRNPPPPITPPGGKVKVMEGERVAFTEEGQPGQYLKLVASGDVDDTMLEALEDFVKRQRKRLAASARTNTFDDLVE